MVANIAHTRDLTDWTLRLAAMEDLARVVLRQPEASAVTTLLARCLLSVIRDLQAVRM